MLRTLANLIALAAAVVMAYAMITMTHVVVPWLVIPWLVGFIQGGIHHENKD